MFNLGQFLNVVGSGELLKIAFRSKQGFRFIGRTIELYDNKEIQAIYDYPIYNVYTCEIPEASIAVVLDDIQD